MTASEPVILEVALNGVTSAERNPAVPRRPEAIAEDALRCLDAGASIVHTHTDEFALPPEKAADLYLQAYRRILAARPDAILYPTAGFGDSPEERHRHHDLLAAADAIRMGLLDPGSVNLGSVGADGLPPDIDFVYANGPREIRHQLQACRRLGLGGSIAVFEPGWLRVVLACRRAGTLPPGSLVKLYFSERGYLGDGEPMFSPPPIAEALALYRAMLGGRLGSRPTRSEPQASEGQSPSASDPRARGLAQLGDAPPPWAVAVLGGSLLDSPLASLALQCGGHLRVGLEDHPDAESNRAEVERAAELCAAHGRRLATPAEAARILGLPRPVC